MPFLPSETGTWQHGGSRVVQLWIQIQTLPHPVWVPLSGHLAHVP